MYVIRITTATGRRFYWSYEFGGVRVYNKKTYAEDTILFRLSPIDGDRREIIRLPYIGE